MACPCQKKRRPMAGRPVKAAADSPTTARKAKALTSSAVPTGQWATSCDPVTPIRSLIKAQRAARSCGGRVIPV